MKYLVLALLCGIAAADICDTSGEFFHVHTQCVPLLRVDTYTDIHGKLVTLCGGAMDDYIKCMKVPFEGCDAAYRTLIDGQLSEFKSRVCVDDTTLDPDMLILMPKFQCIFNQSYCPCDPPFEMCNWWDAWKVFGECFDRLYYSSFYNVTISSKPLEWDLPILKRMSKGILRCSRARIDTRTACDELSRSAMIWFTLYALIPPGADVVFEDARPRTSVLEQPRSTVAAFGDPHIQGYGMDTAVTCSAPGRQVYLDNDFTTVVGYNVFATPDSPATMINKVEITLRNETSGEVYAEYACSNGNLPKKFVSGESRVEVIPGNPDADITIAMFKDTYLVIQFPTAAMSFIIGKFGLFHPILSVRCADSILLDSTGLLVEECPDRINRTVARRKRSTVCEDACSTFTDFFYDTCIFDCEVTGDPGFAQAGNPQEAEETLSELDDAYFEADEPDKNPDNGAGILTGGTAVWLSAILFLVARNA